MGGTKISLASLAAAGALLCAGAAPAYADPQLLPSLGDVAIDQSVMARSRSDYDALGVGVASFSLFPTLTGGFGYDSNIYNSDLDKRVDEDFTIQPDLTLRSNWTRDALAVNAGGTFTRYVSTPSEDSDQYHVSAESRFDLSHDITAALSGGYNRAIEARGSFGDVIVGGEPSRYDALSGHASTAVQLGPLLLTPGASIVKSNYLSIYDGSTTFSQAYRDHRETDASMRADYSLSPAVRLFASGVYNWQDYQHNPVGDNQNAKGYSFIGGATFGLTGLMSGEFGVGYLRESYVNPELINIGGLTYEAKLIWNPTALLTVTLRGNKTLSQSPYINQSGILVNTLALGVDYELLKDLILSISGGYEADDYRGIDRHDRLYTQGFRARYLINRSLEAGLTADHRFQSTAGTVGRRYTGTMVALSLTVKR